MGTDLYSQPGMEPNFNHLHPSPSAPKLIGLAGYAGSGKDAVGKILNDLYGHKRISFADGLRRFVYAQDLYTPEGIKVNDLVDSLGWETAKREHPYIRALLQRTGEDAGRTLIGPDVWVDVAFQEADVPGYYVFTDVRYPNEALSIVEIGGKVLWIERPGVGPVNFHPSEVALDGWVFDGIIENDGTLLDLQGTVMIALGDLG